MKKICSVTLLALLWAAFFCGSNLKVDKAQSIVDNMIAAVNSVNTMAYEMTNTERINGQLKTGKQFVKYQKQPLKCYLYMIIPSSGSQILYIAGKNDNKAIYKPNSFPYVKMSLDPRGSLMTKNNHHTIFDLGFSYFSSIIQKNLQLDRWQITYSGDTVWNKKSCMKILLRANSYKLYNYYSKPNESLSGIANRLGLSLYKIENLNKSYGANEILNQGTTLILPNSYAKTMEIYIEKSNNLPILQKIYDDKGLFEEYQYTTLAVNPKFTDKDFVIK